MSRPLFVRKLTRAEKLEIESLVRSSLDARVVRRAQMIRLSAQGKKAHEIAELLGFTKPTVYRAIHAFNQGGAKALPDKPRSGRPPKAGREYVKQLKLAVSQSPVELGYPFSSWTLSRLREHLARQCGVLVHPDYLGRLCARNGIVYRRPRHVMAHLRDQDDYDEKKELLDFLKKTPSPKTPTSTCSSRMSVRFTSTQP